MDIDAQNKSANMIIMERTVLIAAIIILGALSFKSYVLFHTLDELFCVLISFGVLLVTLYTPVKKDSFLFLIGIAYGFVGAFDLMHTLAYEGMGVFPGNTSNLATQFWISARFLQAGSLFIAALLAGKQVNHRTTFLAAAFISILLGTAIITGVFPDCFIPGSGLTLFKKVSEYVIILLLLASVVILRRQQNENNQDSEVYHNLIKACIIGILAESFFTLYVSVYGLENMIGHLLKLLSFYYIYKAIIEAYLWLPYVEAWKRLKAEEALRESDIKLRDSMAMLERAQRIRGIGYWTLYMANMELKWSPQARIIYVGDADFDLTYETAEKLTHPEDLANVKAAIEKAITQRMPTEIEHRIIRPSGSEAIVNLDMEMDIDDDGQIVRLFGTIVDVTKERQAEAALRLSEEKFSKAFHGTPVMMTLATFEEGRYIDANDALCAATGFLREEIIGHTSSELNLFLNKTNPDDLAKTIREGRLDDYELDLRTKTGEIRNCICWTQLLYINKELCHITGMIDITERKKVEEKLINERQRLFDVLETLNFNICLLTPDYQVVWENRAYREKYGLSNGRLCYDFTLGLDKPCENCQAFRPLTTGQPHHWLFTVDDGNTFIDVYNYPFTDSDGKALVLEMSQDITERIQMERDLRLSEEKFSKAFHGAPIMMNLATIAEGRFIDTNEALCTGTGYTMEEIIGHTGGELNLFPNITRTDLVTKLINEDGLKGYEIELRTKSGEIRNCLSWTQLINLSNELCHITAIIDVTEQRRATQELERLVVLKDQFLANTSHELKTPLNAIIGIADSLCEDISDKLDPEQKEHFSIIGISARRLSNLINDILDISQLKNGEIKLSKKPVRISDLIRHVRLGFEYLNDKKEVAMIWKIPEDLPRVVVDGDRIKQVLYNLIDNALKFTEQGEITTIVSVEEEIITVSVEDTGIGIAKDKYEDIFTAFYQVEDPLTRYNSGIGLGLSITKQLIELHGSKLMLESEENKGSKFSFTLPVFRGQVPDEYQINELMPERYISKRESTELHAEFTQNENQILIVDDDYANLQTAMITLRKEGYSIAVATNGQEALKMIDANPNICLVILDLMLPGMNGYDVCRIIRNTKDYHELPILMLTGRSYSDSILMGFDAGANDFLAKPFDPGELKARVKTLIELRINVHRALRTEIKFLQSQIKPHFIHNALNTIISISRKDHERAILLLVEFSNYLRGCFEHENLEDSISVETEMSLIQSYIAIEKARWGDKIKIQYHIDNRDVAIPPLIIQPIVENCVVHGLRAKPEGGTIIVSVQSNPEKIIITIQDDGLGMSPEKVASLLTDNIVSRGVGLYNINQRLRKLYGAELSIKSETNKGTVVQMEIPNGGGVI